MPIGFGLYSFDFLAAFQRRTDGDAGATPPDGSRAQVSDADRKAADRDLQATAEHAFWGLRYFPVL